jgi:protein-L-isoaspartate(D-aspartate) O-methyltransferase
MDAHAPASQPPFPPDERQAERDRMIEEQLAAPSDRRSPVIDPRVLQAMRRVPRHRFVPDELAPLAYDDSPLSIGRDQTISQPYMVGKMSELLEIDPGAKVLEVGTGSGYQAAVLAAMGTRVVSVERDPSLAEEAKRRLEALGFDVIVRCADGYRGAPEEAPFDAIVVAAAPDHVPKPLLQQLADGGRMIVPIGRSDGEQELRRIVRSGDRMQETRLFPVRFVPMTGESEHHR